MTNVGASFSTGVMEYYPLYYKDLHVHVDDFMGFPWINIKHRLPGGYTTNKGVSLTLEEWQDLVSISPIDVDALRMVIGRDPNETWSHSIGERGRRVVVSQFHGQFHVNIRNWWAQRTGEPPRPTKIGVAMASVAFDKLLEYSIFIEEDIAIIVSCAELRRQEHEAFNRRLEERRRHIEDHLSAIADVIPGLNDTASPPCKRRMMATSSGNTTSVITSPICGIADERIPGTGGAHLTSAQPPCPPTEA